MNSPSTYKLTIRNESGNTTDERRYYAYFDAPTVERGGRGKAHQLACFVTDSLLNEQESSFEFTSEVFAFLGKCKGKESSTDLQPGDNIELRDSKAVKLGTKNNGSHLLVTISAKQVISFKELAADGPDGSFIISCETKFEKDNPYVVGLAWKVNDKVVPIAAVGCKASVDYTVTPQKIVRISRLAEPGRSQIRLSKGTVVSPDQDAAQIEFGGRVNGFERSVAENDFGKFIHGNGVPAQHGPNNISGRQFPIRQEEAPNEPARRPENVPCHTRVPASGDLFAAIDRGNSMAIERLAKDGADVNASRERRPALIWAARAGSTNVVQALLDNGADPCKKGPNGETALHDAAFNGHKSVTNMLISKMPELDIKDRKGQTPLHYAVKNKKTETLYALINGGADLDRKDQQGQTALHYAVQEDMHRIVQVLLGGNADADVKDAQSQTPLHCAAKANKAKLARALIGGNADINVKDRDRHTPLHYAAKYDGEEVASVLAHNNADANVKDRDGQTPLHFAAKYSGANIVYMLANMKDTDHDLQDNRGQTPLHLAASNGKVDTVQILIDNEEDPELEDKDGNTPIDLAWRKRIVKMLTRYAQNRSES